MAKNQERVYLDLSRGQFQRIKDWAIKLPRDNRAVHDFIVILMDAQDDYLKRVKEKHRDKNPQPKLSKRGPIREFLKEDNEDTNSHN